jgi:hypothetical protein
VFGNTVVDVPAQITREGYETGHHWDVTLKRLPARKR